METNGLNRHTTYALLSAGAAGLISFLMIATFLDMLTWVFLPAVMIMVFVSAYFAFRRQMRGRGALHGKKIFSIALEVGILSHFYTFALFFPLHYFVFDFSGISLEIVGTYLVATLVVGLISLVMFVWIAVPMYVGVGYLLKSMEGGKNDRQRAFDDSILDDDFLTTN